AAGEHARAYVLGHVAELGPQLLVGECHADVDRLRDRRGVATEARAVLVEHRGLVRPGVGSDERYVPPVGVRGRDPQRHLLAAAADPDREAGAHRLRLALRALPREELAV